MSKIFLIFKNSILRNMLMLIMSLAAAALMGFIFYTNISSESSVYSDSNVSVGVVNSDNSALSENLKEYLTNSLEMKIISEDYDNLSALLIDRKISAIIEVPQGFETSAISGSPKKLDITTLDDYENSAFIEAYLNSYMRSVSVISQAANGSAEAFSEMLSAQKSPNTITLAEMNAQTDKREKAIDAYVFSVGFILFMISGITVFISNQILTDRQLGTFDRMKCSSIKSSEYVIGVSLFGIVCCTASNLLFNVFAFSVCEEMPIPFGLGFWINELFMIFSVGLAVLIALIANEQLTLMSFGIGYATIGSMLGGAWFPINADLGFISGLSKIFPQYWLMDLIRKYPVDPDLNVLPNICILALSAVLVYLISAVIFTRKNA